MLNVELESEFGEDSLAVIEYLRQRNSNVYDIREIKATLKENKKEQSQRIRQIREAYQLTRHLETVIANDTQAQIEHNNHKLIDELT